MQNTNIDKKWTNKVKTKQKFPDGRPRPSYSHNKAEQRRRRRIETV